MRKLSFFLFYNSDYFKFLWPFGTLFCTAIIVMTFTTRWLRMTFFLTILLLLFSFIRTFCLQYWVFLPWSTFSLRFFYFYVLVSFLQINYLNLHRLILSIFLLLIYLFSWNRRRFREQLSDKYIDFLFFLLILVLFSPTFSKNTIIFLQITQVVAVLLINRMTLCLGISTFSIFFGTWTSNYRFLLFYGLIYFNDMLI